MDGFLPPVDVGGWLEFQRKRAQQLARERIAAANQTIGAGAQATGDWIGRAGQQIDGLLPDWAAQPAEPQPPQAPQPPSTPTPSPYAVQEVGQGVGDWAQRANERIGGLIDQAQGIVPGVQRAVQGPLDRLGAVIAQPDAPDPWAPRPAGTPSGASWLGQGLREQGSTMIDTAERDAELTGPAGMPLPGAVGMRQAAGHTLRGVGNVITQLGQRGEEIERIQQEPDSAENRGRIARAGIEGVAGGLPSAFLGAAAHGAATGAGLPEPVANVVGQVGEALAPDSVIDIVVGGLVKGGWRFARPVVARAIEAIGVEDTLRLLARAPQAAFERIAQVAERYAVEMDPSLATGIVKQGNYDPSGIDPVQGRLAARGRPGRAPGPAMLGPVTAEQAERAMKGKNPVGYGAEYTGRPLSSEPFPPGPLPGGEYEIEHPTLGTLRAAPPKPSEWLTSDGYVFWDRVTSGQTPYKADYQKTLREAGQPRYLWDRLSEPPPAPGEPGYGRLPSLAEKPLNAPDWDTKLAGWTPPRGTDPQTLRHLLNRYTTQERFPHEAVTDLVPSHPDLATPEAQAAALDDLQAALNKAKARRSSNEDRAIASERNVRKEKAPSEEGDDPDAGDGNYSYRSKKGVTPDGEVGGEFHLTSSYEVANAMRFDLDPDVVSYQKGAGPRGRVRVVIDPKYGYNPTDPKLMVNSDPGPGAEVIYSPDWLVTFRDGTQRVVETKNAGIIHIPAWRIEAKGLEGQKHFEDAWGVGYLMMAEDQIGRAFMRELGETDPTKLPADSLLRRLRPGDLADFQAKMRSAWKASRGASDEQTLANAQHILDLNAQSKFPPTANLDDSLNVQQYLSAARAQAEHHNLAPDDGWTFAVDQQNIPMAPGLGGFMVPVTPENRRITYFGHNLSEYRLAQFRHENEDLFTALPDARLTTRKGFDAKGQPVTNLEVTIRQADGQAAIETANLFRAPMVYTIDTTTAAPVRASGMVGRGEYDRRGLLEQLERINADAAARAARGGTVTTLPEYRTRGGRLARSDADLLRPAPRSRPGRAAAGRGAGVPDVPGVEAGATDRAGAVAGAGVPEPVAGAGLPDTAGAGLASDGGRSDLVGGSGSAGVTAQPGDGFRGALDAALAGVQPYGYARTAGQRAFDLSGGTAGAVAGAASADEDATWQERVGRGAAGAVVGSLVGPTGRGALAQYGRKRLTDRSAREAGQFGVAAGRAGTTGTTGTEAPPAGRVVWRDIPELLSVLPLAAPTSLAANLTGGMARSLERVLGKVGEGRPVEAVVDLAAMLREVPGAARGLRRGYGQGPTVENPGMTGETIAQGLGERGGWAQKLAAGVKANAATDAFWRQLNEAGAGAAARRRGAGALETARMRQSAGDFATFAGPNSRVAQGLTKLKRTIHDPDAPFVDKAAAWGVTSMAPYVMMPERLLRATVGALVPAESAVGAVRAFQKGDKAAARELAGRAAAGMAVTGVLTKMYLDGAVTGDAPSDANERRRREAQGAQWNTIQLPGGARVPSRFFGSVGMQANAVATTLDAAKRVADKGGDPGAVLEGGVNGAAKWFLDASYLSDLFDFSEQVSKDNATGGVRAVAAGLPSRLTSPVTGIINAADPYEREAETFPEQLASRTGLRAAVPTRIDPLTGEDQRRAGSGWSRYWGERGTVPTEAGAELARLGVQPRVLGKNEEFEGARQTREQRRLAQRALGSEANRALREALAKPDYAGLPDEEKKSRLQAALRAGAERADLVLGEQVTRGTKQQAQREWDAVPQFIGVQGTPEEIRRQNAEIAQAKALESRYRDKYGDPGWRSKMNAEEPEALRLANRDRRPANVLKREREAIEKRYGVDLG